MFMLVIDFIIYYIKQLYHNTTDFQDVLTEKEFLEMPLIKKYNYISNNNIN
jgi:hypothetical protein